MGYIVHGLKRGGHDWMTNTGHRWFHSVLLPRRSHSSLRRMWEFWQVFLIHSISSVQSLSCTQLFVTPWTAACQAFLSITNSRGPPKLMSIESVMPSNHLILCCPLLLLPLIFSIIRVFSNESALRIRWPKYWSFSFNISPSNEHSGLISFRMDWLDLLAVQVDQNFGESIFFGSEA